MFSYHNHSTFSDGTAELETMIASAVSAGLTEIGMSDHFTILPGNKPSGWSMTFDSINDYFPALDRLKEKYSDRIIVRKGTEIDYCRETIDMVYDKVMSYSPDYIIGSVHYAWDFPIDREAEDWLNISAERANEIIECYWKKIIMLAADGRVNIIGHIDLYKKFGNFGTLDVSDYIQTALEAIKDSGIAMEINTAGLYKPIGEYYPSQNIIEKAVKMEIPIVVNTDAHAAEHLTRSIRDVLELLARLGVKQIAGFENCRQILRDLSY